MMKREHFLVVAVVVLAAMGIRAEEQDMSFKTVTSELNISKNTSLYVKSYWNKIKGEEIEWEGIVKDVKGNVNRGRAEVFVANKESKTYKGFNIVLKTYDVDAAASLKVKQHIKFKGTLSNYKAHKGGLVVIYLDAVEIVKPKE